MQKLFLLEIGYTEAHLNHQTNANSSSVHAVMKGSSLFCNGMACISVLRFLCFVHICLLNEYKTNTQVTKVIIKAQEFIVFVEYSGEDTHKCTCTSIHIISVCMDGSL